MITSLEVPYHEQHRDYTCGPACLRMVLEYFGVQQDEVSLTMLCGTTLAGTGLAEIAEAAQRYGDCMATKQGIKKAHEKAMDYLVAYVGEKAVAGTPHFDLNRKVWSVPVLCHTKRGIFLGGKIELDERLEIIYAPSKNEFTRVVEEQLKRLPAIVYADEDELVAKGFEVAKIV